jgi:hypothetical protein
MIRTGTIARLVSAALIAAVTLLGGLPGPARAGGSPVGYVSFPSRGALAVIALPGGGVLARVAVPGNPTDVAASVNGRRVLVASPDARAVTEIDGVHPRVLRIFHGFGRPVAVAFDYEPPIGIVTPRYAYVLDRARGTLDVLDLARGQIASRLAVGAQPDQIAVDATIVWIAHAASGMLTRVDVSVPARPRLLEGVNAGVVVAALVADPESRAVYLTSSASGVVTRYLDAGAGVRRGYSVRVGRGGLGGLALALPNFLISADQHGHLFLLDKQNGRPVSRLQMPPGVKALDVYGGWLVAMLPRSLILLAVPDGSMRTSVRFGTNVGGFAWAVL